MAEPGQQQWTLRLTEPSQPDGDWWLLFEDKEGLIGDIALPKFIADGIVADHNAHQDAAELRAGLTSLWRSYHLVCQGRSDVGAHQEDFRECNNGRCPELRALLARAAATREEA